MYDVIGDVHGHADCLVKLLELLGYERVDGTYIHRERKVIFLGDFIDSGPNIREVLQIVRPMIEEGQAFAVMGDHEFTFLAYGTRDPNSPDQFLRRHSEKNERQHLRTLRQIPADELAVYFEWFRTLPMWLDLDGLRVVHACWDTQQIEVIQEALERHQGVTDAFLQSACSRGSALSHAVNVVLKGKKLKLPNVLWFCGNFRTKFRTRWYLPVCGQTVRTYAFQSDVVDCDMNVETLEMVTAEPYSLSAKPVFIGHYSLRADEPGILADNVACVDYGVAKRGFLCAYRWEGEQTLTNEHFTGIDYYEEDAEEDEDLEVDVADISREETLPCKECGGKGTVGGGSQCPSCAGTGYAADGLVS